MAVNARTEEFQHIEVFDKPALFTNGRIARDTVPKGWYCYDMRGSDDDPGELCYMEENVVVNHAGSVLMPEKLAMPKSGRLDVRDELGFLDEGNMTLREFCEAHQLPYARKQKAFSPFCILTNDSIGSRYLFTRNEQMPDILLHCHLLPQKAKDSAADGQ